MASRIGVVTGGGDCPGLNAVIRAAAKAAHRSGWEAVGILGGYEGLLPQQQTKMLQGELLAGLLVRGGTILRKSYPGAHMGFQKPVGAGFSRL